MTANNKIHEQWMKAALKEAISAFKNNEVPIGAVVVHEDRIIGKGYNQRELLNDPTAHAEIIALTSAANTLESWRLDGCKIYVTKEPCPMCAGAIMNARMELVVFGAYDESAGCCGSLYQICKDPRFNHQVNVRGGILKEDCSNIIKEFFNIKRMKN